MNDDSHLLPERLPSAVPWSAAAVRLLQGIVYHDDAGDVWDRVLESVTPLTDYFVRIGLRLIVDEENGMAYLRQIAPESFPPEYPPMPTLFRRTRLGFDQSILCVLLRDELRQFEEQIHHDERCVVNQSDLLSLWSEICGHEEDPVRLNRKLTAHLKSLQEMKFVKQFSDTPPAWEVRRILKARLPLAQLEQMRTELVAELARRRADSAATPEDPSQAVVE
ncbi:DUF4194 domain-containing protein [Roseimaritima sediminicola]|uniref:DUF4194 domain-containing protein n=1 Tax=Roseimaritima sediminicola TaxID=2662066 RepID=UPI00129853D1|nr:DUF4194 domain-containing protein [Roseimaritima sediminicola]